MEWDRIQANWQSFRALVRARWARISDEQLDTIGGSREQLVRQVHALYGISLGMAQMQVESWQGRLARPTTGDA
jgi:uncharacterized protein YjbJ (UPF0337 family)